MTKLVKSERTDKAKDLVNAFKMMFPEARSYFEPWPRKIIEDERKEWERALFAIQNDGDE